MMKWLPMRPSLSVLLALFLVGLPACSSTPSEGDPPDLGAQTAMPSTIPPPDSEAGEATEASPPIYTCIDSDPHPIGQSIAATYEVSYQQVMTWFCSGYSFDNILVALETSAAVDIPAEQLLQMLEEHDWEEIWVEVGFTGDQ